MRVTEADIRAAVYFGARAQGCTCAVDIAVDELTPGLFKATAEHDDRCPLLMAQARHAN